MRPRKPYLYAVSIVEYPVVTGSEPWEGESITTVPVKDYAVPGTTPAAEEFNYTLQQATGAARAIYDDVGQIIAHNFKGAVTPDTITTGGGSFVGMTAPPAWDGVNGRWLSLCNYLVTGGNNVHRVSSSIDGGKIWTHLTATTFSSSTSNPPLGGLAVRPSDGLILVTGGSTSPSGAFQGLSWTFASGSWTSHTNAPNSLSAPCIAWFNSQFVFLGHGVSALVAATSPDGVTWTDRTSGSGLPSGFFPARCASNGTLLCVFGYNGTNSGTVYYSTNGIGFASHAIAPITSADETIVGAAYSDLDFTWLITTYNATSGDSRVLKSQDGTTWTVANANFTGVQLAGIACLGTLWMILVSAPYGGGANQDRVLYSIDAGTSWRWGVGGAFPSQVNSSGAAGGVSASPCQFMPWNADAVNASFATGNSDVAF